MGRHTRTIATLVVLAMVAVAGFFGARGSSQSLKRCEPWPQCRATTSTTVPTTTTTPPPVYLFDDEFSGTGPPDPAKWWITPWCGSSPNEQEVCWNPANVFQNGAGQLVLEVTAGTMGRPYDAGRVQTFREGSWPPPQVFAQLSPPIHVEARIKFAPGAGMWEGFWFGSNTDSAHFLEMDAQEFRGAVPFEVTSHLHGIKEWGALITAPFDGTAAYHTYWVDYYSDHAVFGVDGLTVGSVTLPAAPPEMIRLMNQVGVPGTWGGQGGPPPAGDVPGVMLVDYVRAWALP